MKTLQTIDLDLGLDLTHNRQLPSFVPAGKSLLGRHHNQVMTELRTPDLYTLQQVKNRLQWQLGRELYDQMYQDDMVKSGTVSWASSIVQDCRLQAAGDTQECKWVLDKFDAMIKAIPGGFLQKLYAMYMGARHGFSVHQKHFKIASEGECLNYIVLSDLEYLLPNFLYPCFDERGKLIAIMQLDPLSGQMWTTIPLEQVLHFVNQPQEDAFAGESIYIPAHPHWQAKQIIMALRNNNLELSSGRLVVKHVKAEEGLPRLTEPEFDSRATDLINNYLLYQGFKLWSGMDFQFIQSNTSPEAYDKVLDFCNKGILRSIGPPWLTIEEGQFGTRAQADIHSSEYEQRIRPLRQMGEELFVDANGPFYQVCKANGWALKHMPRLILSKAKEEDLTSSITVFLQASQQGVVKATEADENEIRKRLGWIETEQEEPSEATEAGLTTVTSSTTDAALSPMNGAQIDSARTIIADISTGALPIESARAMLEGFLALPPDVVGRVLKPFIDGYRPSVMPVGVEAPEPKQPQLFADGRYSKIDFTPPSGVREAAKRGLELRREFGRGGTAVGLARARDLSNGKRISPDTARRMYSFFARHEVDKRSDWGNPENPSNGYIAWMLWGGDAGKQWVEKLRRQMESADELETLSETIVFEDEATRPESDSRAVEEDVSAIALPDELSALKAKIKALEVQQKSERYQFADAIALLRDRIEGGL